MTRLSLSSAATRWGSASADGSIRLNWRLVHFALPMIDYVVAHELAHLREMNHSPRFWDVVRSVLPDYEAARGTLRDEVLPARCSSSRWFSLHATEGWRCRCPEPAQPSCPPCLTGRRVRARHGALARRLRPRRRCTPSALPHQQPACMQVGDRLAHRERGLVQVELAPEQHRQQVGGALRRCGAGRHHVGQAFVVVRPAAGRCARAGRGTACRARAAPACRPAARACARSTRGTAAAGWPRARCRSR